MWVSRSLILIMFGYLCEITNSINTYLQFMQTFASLQGLNLQPYVSLTPHHPGCQVKRIIAMPSLQLKRATFLPW